MKFEKTNDKGSKRPIKTNKTKQSLKKSQKNKWKVIGIALYVTFLLLSTVAYTANDTVEAKLKESYEYHLTYRTDGRQSHYYVERIDSNNPGKIDQNFWHYI